MGLSTTRGIMDFSENMQKLSIDRMLSFHLRNNHYPPIDLSFIKTAKIAIKEAEKGHWEKKIKMPNGITKTVMGIIDRLHLEEFMEID